MKRSGKNNFAFYEPEMSLANYKLKGNQIVLVPKVGVREEELRHLLNFTTSPYFSIVLFNLTKNYSRILSIGNKEEKELNSQSIADFLQTWKKNIHPNDQSYIVDALSKDALLLQYAQGKQQLEYYYSGEDQTSQEKTEVKVHFYISDTREVCAFLFFQRSISFEKELELLRLQKIIEMSSATDIEYICLINILNKYYSTFSRDNRNSHFIPEIADFDMVTKHIRDTLIPSEERDKYYQNAALEYVLQCMRENGQYSYRYTMIDGITREATFKWYEKSYLELIMVVKKIIL